MDVIDWLLDAEPAVRWQVLRDLAGADPAAVATERARVAREGTGAAILRAQGGDGAWHQDGEPDWFPTLHHVQLLRLTGIDPAEPEVAAAIARLADGFRWHEEFGARPLFDGEVEACINGRALAAGAYFGRPSASLAERLIGDQLADGGWNCDAPKSARGSYHSTICVLEGLLDHERATGGSAALGEARRRGEAYLFDRELFRRRSTGDVCDPGFLRFAFPPRYYYDVLRALDYLRATGAAPDPRAAAAVEHLRARRQPDGRWVLDAEHGDGAFELDLGERVGEPSRWITLRALRVLRWYDA